LIKEQQKVFGTRQNLFLKIVFLSSETFSDLFDVLKVFTFQVHPTTKIVFEFALNK
jgi:hypothetical protein